MWFVLMVGCTNYIHHLTSPVVSNSVAPKPVVKTEVVVHVERVPVRLNPASLTCPPDPVLPLAPTQRQLGVYIAKLIEVADQCRANLQALSTQ